ncbi:uncharacterized protein LTR77_003517 [Saxophila tyrrhenica]|uniref:Uncharacterized protein n=1 Tax=Saxophila tyrrhenica TaxID=1690608 RepID=A0AAV9PEJ9_9PEZI|nr:hypothetical protein LTR77_003517 [Saxophila tyrrhenica]
MIGAFVGDDLAYMQMSMRAWVMLHPIFGVAEPSAQFHVDVTELPSMWLEELNDVALGSGRCGATPPFRDFEELRLQQISEPPLSVVYIGVFAAVGRFERQQDYEKPTESETTIQFHSRDFICLSPIACCSLRVTTGVTIGGLIEGIKDVLRTLLDPQKCWVAVEMTTDINFPAFGDDRWKASISEVKERQSRVLDLYWRI